MALNRWIANAPRIKQTGTITIAGTPAAGNTVTCTMNGKITTYTVITGDTTSLVAEGLASAIRQADDGEFRLFLPTVESAVITLTATEAGVPFTVTGAGNVTVGATGGGATATYAAVTSNSSPNDVANVLNWSAGSLPVDADTVLLENCTEGMYWNLTALAAITCATFKVRNTFVPDRAYGWIGNPIFEPSNGFREFRGTELSFEAATVLEVNLPTNCPAEAFKFECSSTQCALKITGDGNGSIGSECVWWRGTHASNAIEIYGGSLAIWPQAFSSTATAVVATIKAISASIRLEAGVTVGTSITMRDSVLDTRVTVPTLSMDSGADATSAVIGRDAAAISTALVIDGGTVFWNSTGTIATMKGASGGGIDFSGAKTAVTVGGGAGTVVLDEGFVYIDREQRTIPFTNATTVLCNRTGMGGVQFDFGTHLYLQASPGP